jgi:hypothetical protein
MAMRRLCLYFLQKDERYLRVMKRLLKMNGKQVLLESNVG